MGLNVKCPSSLSTGAMKKTHIKIPIRTECEAKSTISSQSGISAGFALVVVVFWGRRYITVERQQ